MKTGKTYWGTKQIGEKERQRENRLGREGIGSVVNMAPDHFT